MASPFCFRPSLELAERIDEAARVEGVSRAQWLAAAAEFRLDMAGLKKLVAVPEGGDPGALATSGMGSAPADGSARADAFRAASLRRLR